MNTADQIDPKDLTILLQLVEERKARISAIERAEKSELAAWAYFDKITAKKHQAIAAARFSFLQQHRKFIPAWLASRLQRRISASYNKARWHMDLNNVHYPGLTFAQENALILFILIGLPGIIAGILADVAIALKG